MLASIHRGFLLAVLAEEVAYLLTLNKPLEAFVDALAVLYLQGKVVELLDAVFDHVAALALHAHYCTASEHVVQNAWEASSLQLSLQLLE